MYLTNELKNKKILDADVEVSDFIKEKGITKNAMVFAIEFDKKVFKEESEVREWMQNKYQYFDDIIVAEGSFRINLLSTNSLSNNVVEVEVRRGVKLFAADYMMNYVSEYLFSEKSELMIDIDLANKTVSDKKAEVIPLVKVIKGTHPSFGEINITKDHLKSFVTNFENKVTGVDLAINEDHKKNEAFAWIKEVFLSEDGNTLLGKVKWNKKGTKALNESEYRYFSPEFRLNFVHPHTDVEHGPTLIGGALTNYPFLKMDAITALNNKETLTKEKDVELKDQVVELSAKNENLEKKTIELSAKLEKRDSEVIELAAKVTTLTKEKEDNDKKAKNQSLFDKGRINAAQLVALNEGKSLEEVLELSEKMNTKPAGAAPAGNTTVIELSEADKAAAKVFGLTEEEYALGMK